MKMPAFTPGPARFGKRLIHHTALSVARIRPQMIALAMLPPTVFLIGSSGWIPNAKMRAKTTPWA